METDNGTRPEIGGAAQERHPGTGAVVGRRRRCQRIEGTKRAVSLKTFLDSGALLTAWRGGFSPEAQAALSVMADDQREFFTSDNVKLELLPKPSFEKRRVEVAFYEAHFNAASAPEPFSSELGTAALALAKKHGLSAGDALNLAAAIRQGAEEFITSESPGKPIFRVGGIRVLSLHALAY
jgi:predicted nucleic acid-binding protein